MASLLVGDYVAIDHSDAAGMTLMDLHQRTWSPDALNVSTLLSKISFPVGLLPLNALFFSVLRKAAILNSS